MSQDTPLKTLFRMRPELERDVLRFMTGEDVPYATALGWVVQAAEIAHAALEVDQARREAESANSRDYESKSRALDEFVMLENRLRAELKSKSDALSLALQERDDARARLRLLADVEQAREDKRLLAMITAPIRFPMMSTTVAAPLPVPPPAVYVPILPAVNPQSPPQ